MELKREPHLLRSNFVTSKVMRSVLCTWHHHIISAVMKINSRNEITLVLMGFWYVSNYYQEQVLMKWWDALLWITHTDYFQSRAVLSAFITRRPVLEPAFFGWVAKCSISLVGKWYILIVLQCYTHLWEVRQSSTGPKMTWWTKFYICKGRWTMFYWPSCSSRTKFYLDWLCWT